jgi:hypothetical protein
MPKTTKEYYSPEFEEPEITNVDTSSVASTTRTANIRIIDREINVFVNEHGQQTPILIVARAKVDNREYAALYDTATKKRYSVEIVRTHGEIKEFRDLDGPDQDEEWAVVSNFFLKEKVFEESNLNHWITRQMLSQKLSLGRSVVPSTTMRRWKDHGVGVHK